MPSTRCARRERAHRQGRDRAGAAPQLGVARPPPALGEATAVQDCGHTAARRVLRRRRVRRSAASGRCGTAGSSGAELGRCLVPFGATFGISLSRTERLLLVHRLSFWLNCCSCCLLPRSGSIAAVRNIRRRAAASLQPSSTGQKHRGYVALATLLNRLL